MHDRFLSRGKAVIGGKWVQGFYSCTNENYMYVQGQLFGICNKRNPKDIHFITPFTNIDGIITPWSFINVIPETLGGCTSLTDKNDKLMFEGDIVSVPVLRFNGSEDNMIGVIEWRKGAFSVAWNEEIYRRHFLGYLENVEVIGNVYDNPELLQIKKEHKVTNYEHLRSLPLEELAEKFMDGEWCDSHCELRIDNDENCVKCMTEWLKSECKAR